jgi:hypothetical protein
VEEVVPTDTIFDRATQCVLLVATKEYHTSSSATPVQGVSAIMESVAYSVLPAVDTVHVPPFTVSAVAFTQLSLLTTGGVRIQISKDAAYCPPDADVYTRT